MTSQTDAAQRRYDELRGRNYRIDMTRGKPSPEQAELSNPMLTILHPDDCLGEGGDDYRNYSHATGIPEAKRLLGGYMDMPSDQIIAAGNSSLQLMHDVVAWAVLKGVPGGDGPWRDGAKFICPVPGYDRHFAICEQLGIEMITVEMGDDGPDMSAVETLVAEDARIKGIWCVPKYSNPTGAIYADDTVNRLAGMETAAPDFRVFWDDAYSVHHLTEARPVVKNIYESCVDAGCPDRPYMFASTSKISIPGAGLSAFAASAANVADIARKMSFQTIGPDKLNQLRHTRFFKDLAGIESQMEKHAALIGPKFDAVDAALTKHLGGTGLAHWRKPTGGYFFSVDLQDNCAKEVVRLAGEAGVTLTPAGATFPYGNDPHDRNLRLAPTYPSLDEIDRAMEIFCACVELASAGKG